MMFRKEIFSSIAQHVLCLGMDSFDYQNRVNRFVVAWLNLGGWAHYKLVLELNSISWLVACPDLVVQVCHICNSSQYQILQMPQLWSHSSKLKKCDRAIHEKKN
jgi:hypothetical protein